MMFAMIAGLAVAYMTQPVVAEFAGGSTTGEGFLVAACLFGVISLFVFPIVFASTREPPDLEVPPTSRSLLADYWLTLKRNRAFWIVMIAIACTVGCSTAIGKSVLYYFKYYLHDESAARYALTLTSASGLVILPAWIFVERRVGKRVMWFVATILGICGLVYFWFTDIRTVIHMIGYLLFMQIPLQGMAMTFWSMLPDTVEYGEWRTGVRAESFIFGLGQFFLKGALGMAAGAFGLALQAVGYMPNAVQTAATLSGMKDLMIFIPLTLFCVGGIAMLHHPLRRGTHERIVEDLRLGIVSGGEVQLLP